MSNPKVEYNNYVRANLPDTISYDSVRNQYVTINGKRFVTYKEAKWYVDYVVKITGITLVGVLHDGTWNDQNSWLDSEAWNDGD